MHDSSRSRKTLWPYLAALLLVMAGCETAGPDDDAAPADDDDAQGDDDDAQGDDDDAQGDDDTAVPGAIVADHGAVADFDLIPESYFEQIRADHRFFYGHTSHGSQIITGLDSLAALTPGLHAMPSFHEISDDLGHTGDLSWVAPTEEALDADDSPHTVVMWSWCGGCSDNTSEGIDIYLQAMADLETAYPDILFVYMTGHTDGSGADGNLRQRNAQIREWCVANDKVLFDFEDIESWDPDGTYYPDISDDCQWCETWCGTHECPDCTGGCAHSHCFNCHLKGRAWWWMMARVAGWNGS